MKYLTRKEFLKESKFTFYFLATQRITGLYVKNKTIGTTFEYKYLFNTNIELNFNPKNINKILDFDGKKWLVDEGQHIDTRYIVLEEDDLLMIKVMIDGGLYNV